MADTYKGRCFCGAVEFEVEGEAPMQGYCHCADCQAWSGAPVTAFAMWPADKVRITKGEAEVTAFQRDAAENHTIRRSCGKCGGAVPSLIPLLGMSDAYPMLIDDYPFKPALHAQMADSVLKIDDDLPKFDRWPPMPGG